MRVRPLAGRRQRIPPGHGSTASPQRSSRPCCHRRKTHTPTPNSRATPTHRDDQSASPQRGTRAFPNVSRSRVSVKACRQRPRWAVLQREASGSHCCGRPAHPGRCGDAGAARSRHGAVRRGFGATRHPVHLGPAQRGVGAGVGPGRRRTDRVKQMADRGLVGQWSLSPCCRDRRDHSRPPGGQHRERAADAGERAVPACHLNCGSPSTSAPRAVPPSPCCLRPDAHARQVHACGPRGSRSPTSSEVRSFGVSRATIYRALSQDALFPGTVQGEGTVGLNEPPAWVGEGLYCPFRVLALARGPGLAARVADRAPRVLGLSPTRYFQLLSRLLDRPEAGRRRTRAGRPAAGSAGSTPRVAAEPVAIESGYSCRPETRAGPISPS